MCFRAARHETIERVDERTVRVGDALLVRTDGTPAEIVAIAGQGGRELRLAVTAAPEGAAFAIEYRWQEGGR